MALPVVEFANAPLELKSALTEGGIWCNQMELLYAKINGSALGLSFDAFEKAYIGWSKLKIDHQLNKSEILAIADLSQSSNKKRLYILDMEKQSLLFQTFVAHGRNSGEEFAQNFSNSAESYQSSLGFYTTGSTYNGKHGLSLVLKGLEQTINDLAEQRAIVIHGADYVSENFIQKYGRLGRSLGCPAVAPEMCAPIIESIKDGSCFFVYAPHQSYISNSLLCVE